jgi:hypothetical protein
MRVMWRFKRMVLAGLVIAVCLAFLSYFRVSLAGGQPHISYRGKETWESFARVFVTRPGFEWGSSIIGPNATHSNNDASRIGAQVSEEGRLASLASLYSSFAKSDPVRKIMLRSGPIDGIIDAAPLPATPDNPYALLPLVSILGEAHSAAASKSLTGRAADALVTFIRQQQADNRVPADQRIVLTILNRAGDTKRLAGRPKSLPAIVFLMVMLATVGIAFLRENLHPAAPRLASADGAVAVPGPERRSA